MASVFRSFQDTGAPILAGNTLGSLITLLKAVLVDGYGSFDPLGWEVVFDDTASHSCVFRPLGGDLRPFVLVQDNMGSTSDQYAKVTVFESMSSISEGFFQCPSGESDLDNYIIKSKYNTSVGIPWVIIGDNLGFWLLTRPYDQTGTGADLNNGSLHYPHYIGYFPCFILENKYNFITILNNKSDVMFRANLETYGCYMQRDPFTSEIGAVKFTPTIQYSAGDNAFGNSCPNSSPRSGKYMYEPVVVVYDNCPTIGLLPGYFSMLWQTEVEGASWYTQSEEERTPFFEYGQNSSMYIFAQRVRGYSYNSVVSRGSILVGEGFRNAY